jgi:hypothetical protein
VKQREERGLPGTDSGHPLRCQGLEQNRLLELVNKFVEVIYPSGPSGSNRLLVDMMMYKERGDGS